MRPYELRTTDTLQNLTEALLAGQQGIFLRARIEYAARMRARYLLSVHVALMMALGGCSFDPSGVPLDGGDADAHEDADARAPDARRPEVPPPSRLLLTEVALRLNEDEFIEIFNPGATEVDLGYYYLSDDEEYAKLPGSFGAGPAVEILNPSTDFIARFPDGARIGPGEVVVIALDYALFDAKYPDVAHFGVTNAPADKAMVDPGELFIGDDPRIANAGECITLFYWDGMSDLVVDVDMIQLGHDPAEINRCANKSGLSVDGPDEGDEPSTYRDEAGTMPLTSTTADINFSHERITLEDEHQLRAVGANGVDGDDETSEDTSITWIMLTPATPGWVPPSLMGQ